MQSHNASLLVQSSHHTLLSCLSFSRSPSTTRTGPSTLSGIYRATHIERYMLWPGIRPSFRLSQASVLSNRLNVLRLRTLVFNAYNTGDKYTWARKN